MAFVRTLYSPVLNNRRGVLMKGGGAVRKVTSISINGGGGGGGLKNVIGQKNVLLLN